MDQSWKNCFPVREEKKIGQKECRLCGKKTRLIKLQERRVRVVVRVVSKESRSRGLSPLPCFLDKHGAVRLPAGGLLRNRHSSRHRTRSVIFSLIKQDSELPPRVSDRSAVPRNKETPNPARRIPTSFRPREHVDDLHRAALRLKECRSCPAVALACVRVLGQFRNTLRRRELSTGACVRRAVCVELGRR